MMTIVQERQFPKFSYVVCINNEPSKSGSITNRTQNLTLNKRYQVLNEPYHQSEVGVKVINDLGEVVYYNIKRFSSIEHLRNKRIYNFLR